MENKNVAWIIASLKPTNQMSLKEEKWERNPLKRYGSIDVYFGQFVELLKYSQMTPSSPINAIEKAYPSIFQRFVKI